MKTRLNPIFAWVVPFSVQILLFYRQKPNLQDPMKIGGANAPPNSLTKPRKRGQVATPYWWVFPASRSVFILGWIWSLGPRI